MSFAAHGTTFSFGGVVVAELRKIDGPQIKRDDIDVTSHDSNYWKEIIPGLIEGGEVDCEGNYVPSDAGMAALQAAITDVTSPELSTFQVLFPNGYGFSGSCMITNLKPSGPFDEKAEISFTIKTSGVITFITPSS